MPSSPAAAATSAESAASAAAAPVELGVTREAYFGTSQIEAASILEGSFLPRHGEEQYLGTGIYFFDEGPTDAVRWAQRRSPHEWAVLRCTVRLGRCLDLHTRTGDDLLAQLAAGLSAARGQSVREADAIKLLARFTLIETVRAVHRRPKLPRNGNSGGPNRLSVPRPFAPSPKKGVEASSSSAAAAAADVSASTGADFDGRAALQSIICVRKLTNIERVETFRIGS